jgi:hypothetical protein
MSVITQHLRSAPAADSEQMTALLSQSFLFRPRLVFHFHAQIAANQFKARLIKPILPGFNPLRSFNAPHAIILPTRWSLPIHSKKPSFSPCSDLKLRHRMHRARKT